MGVKVWEGKRGDKSGVTEKERGIWGLKNMRETKRSQTRVEVDEGR
mgnify:CR=1 FL=1